MILKIERVSKYYGSVKALSNVSFSVNKGEFLAIVGPSGSGKTTLLNIIGALDSPSEGKVFFEDEDITIKKKKELFRFRLLNIGFVFQAYNLIPVFTAFENVEYILFLRGIPKEERKKRVLNILKELNILELKDRFPSEMSGGEQQRVAVARALVGEPKLVIADEPTANLDSENAFSLIELMYRLNVSKNITFIFSTHDVRIIEKAKRIIKLQDGRIIEDSFKE